MTTLEFRYSSGICLRRGFREQIASDFRTALGSKYKPVGPLIGPVLDPTDLTGRTTIFWIEVVELERTNRTPADDYLLGPL